MNEFPTIHEPTSIAERQRDYEETHGSTMPSRPTELKRLLEELQEYGDILKANDYISQYARAEIRKHYLRSPAAEEFQADALAEPMSIYDNFHAAVRTKAMMDDVDEMEIGRWYLSFLNQKAEMWCLNSEEYQGLDPDNDGKDAA